MEGWKEVFEGEAQEILQNLEPDIIRLEEGSDPEVINRIFRYIHTLKGSSGMAGFNNVSEFTHNLENIMDGARSGKFEINEDLIEILLGSMDWIRKTIFENNGVADLNQMREKLLNSIEEFKENGKWNRREDGVRTEAGAEYSTTDKKEINSGIEITDDSEEAKHDIYKIFRIKAKFKKSIFNNGIDPLNLIENLVSLGRISKRRVDKSALPDFNNLNPEECYLKWDIILRTKEPIEKIEDVFLFVKDDNNIKIEDVTRNYEIPDNTENQKIGEIMLRQNIISEEELSTVLDSQVEGKKIAEIMVEKGYASQDDVNYALEEQDKIKKKIDSTTVRVATGKLDILLNLLGEIVIGQSTISRVAEEIGGEDGEKVKSAVYSLDRTTREFQEEIMAIRMIPIGPSFERVKRFVRDTAKKYGKEIKLEINGAETELDKTVIEKIGDPLKHMIRNSIDHGIETPDERIRTGKSRSGLIQLNAYHQEGYIYIEVSDDGRGIDKNKVRKKAEQMGLANSPDDISNEKLYEYLYMPGFSTAEKVGSLSGRGVGMDVVKTNINELRGTIRIESEPGRGTKFIIKLPLTLAIIDGMLVRVGNHKYVIPLLSIVESLQPEKNTVKTVKGQGEVIYVRGQYVSLLRIYNLFGVEPDFINPWESIVVIVESNGTLLGLMVDEVIGQQQIVIKSMHSGITKNRAISGASILGDGRVSLIIDIYGLVGLIAA